MHSPSGPASGEPDRRALDAMAAAVRRAREGAVSSGGPAGPSLPAVAPGPSLPAVAPEQAIPDATGALPTESMPALLALRAMAAVRSSPDSTPRTGSPTARVRLASDGPDPTAVLTDRPTRRTTASGAGRAAGGRRLLCSSATSAPSRPVPAAPLPRRDPERAAAGPVAVLGGGAGLVEPALFNELTPPREGRHAMAAPPSRSRSHGRHRVVVAVIVVSVAIVVTSGLEAGLRLTASSTRTVPPAAGTRTPPGHSGPSGQRTASGTAGTAARAGAASSALNGARAGGSSPAAQAAGLGTLHVSSVSPSKAGVGQTVTVSGSGLYSSSGSVVAYLGGTPASTSCSSQSSCTATIPDLGVPHRTTLSIRTAGGTSNHVAFDYT